MSKKSVITGTLILTAASIITRFMGFFYRVYMSEAIGAEGIGLYQLILPLYTLAWSITSAGFTTTISHLTAQENIRGESGNIGRIVKLSIFFSLLVSLLVACGLFFFANEIAICFLKDIRAAISLQLLAFAIPFMAMGSCFRGFFLGMQNPSIPAMSQVLEQSIRMIAIFLFAGFLVPYGLGYACLAAVIGILLGEAASCVFVAVNYTYFKRRRKLIRPPVLGRLSACRMVLAMAIPLSATRVAGSALAALENVLIPRQLQLYGQNATEALSNYGELMGMALPLIMLPSACLTAASVSLVPEISSACAIRQNTRINQTISVTFLFTFIVGIGSAAFFAVFPKEICYIVYNRPNLGGLLFPLAFLCPFLYAQTTLHGLLNGLEEQMFLFVSNLLSSLIAIAFVYFLMPLYGIDAFLWGWAISLIFAVVTCLIKLYQRTGIVPQLGSCFFKPMLAGAASGLFIRHIVQIGTPSKLFFLCCFLGMGLLYLLFLLLLGCFSRENMDILFGKTIKR